MILELRNVKLLKSASEETPCYTATVFADGSKVADVTNHGNGGGDMIRPHDVALLAKVEAYFAALPKITVHGYDLAQGLELWCHGEVWAQDALKALKRTLAKKVVVIHGGKEWVFKAPPSALDRLRPTIDAKFPGGVILNGKTDAELRVVIDQVSA